MSRQISQPAVTPNNAPRALKSLGVLVPVFNEADLIDSFYRAIKPILGKLSCETEILFIDDGSSDDTRSAIRRLQTNDRSVRLVRLSRNFGKEAALSAGLDRIETDTVVPMDVDLQDPPELIPEMLKRWEEGHDIVYAIRMDRTSDKTVKRLTAKLFYRIYNLISHEPIPFGAGDYRLLDRRVVTALRQLRERNRFMKGLFAWVGFSSVGVPYVRGARHTGSTRFPWLRLWHLAVDGITGFSTLPLEFGAMSAF